MNHNKSYRKLGRRADHRKAMLKNMTISLIKAERMITFGQKNTLASRRNAFAFLRDEEAVAKIFNEIAPKYAERNGGYTRIIKTSVRKGDSAEMAIIELV